MSVLLAVVASSCSGASPFDPAGTDPAPAARRGLAPRRGSSLPRPPAASASADGTIVLTEPGPDQVLLRGGPFVMGSQPEEVNVAIDLCRREVAQPTECDLPLQFGVDERRLDEMVAWELEAHPVTLTPYWIDRTEVTVAAYRRCVEIGPCRRASFEDGGARFDRPDLPATFVSWDDASTYCKFRGGRLPTEAEWERAARGLGGRRFPWGSSHVPSASNHGALELVAATKHAAVDRSITLVLDASDGYPELAPVGSFPAGRTPEGIDDLAGNVAEWVEDFFEERYDPVSAHDPRGPSTSATRVLRGGSFAHPSPLLRGAARGQLPGSARFSWVGFRCVKPAR